MKTLLITLSIIVLITCTYLYRQSNDYVYSYDDMLIEKHQDTLDVLIDCESGWVGDIVNYNDGKKGSHSYGILQFKKATLYSAIKRYNLYPYAKDYEYENFLYDTYAQKLAASYILEFEKNALNNWYNCAKLIKQKNDKL